MKMLFSFNERVLLLFLAMYLPGSVFAVQGEFVDCDVRIISIAHDKATTLCVEIRYIVPEGRSVNVGYMEPQKPGGGDGAVVAPPYRSDYIKIWPKGEAAGPVLVFPIPRNIGISQYSSFVVPLGQLDPKTSEVCLSIENIRSTLNTATSDRNGMPVLRLKGSNPEGILVLTLPKSGAIP